MSFEEGLRLFKAGEFSSAAEMLQEAVSSDDQNHKAWNALGISYTKLGRYDEAAACYAHALRIVPDNPVYLKNQAINNRKKEESGDLIPSALLSPDDSGKKPNKIAIFVLAAIFIGMIVIGSATLFILNSGPVLSGDVSKPPAGPVTPALAPESETGYETICTEGITLLQAEKPDDALRSFEQAITMYPEKPRAWTGKGYALIDLGRYESAVTAFDTALQLNATYEDAKAGREIAVEASGQKAG